MNHLWVTLLYLNCLLIDLTLTEPFLGDLTLTGLSTG